MIGLGSQSQLGIGIAISLQNRFSGQAAQINQQLVNMRKNANSALIAAAQQYRNQAAGIAAVATAITAGFVSMARSSSEFQHKINQTFIVGGKSLGRTRRDLEDFSKTMSRVFTRDPKEIAQVMFENVKAGVDDGLEEITKYQVAVAAATDEALKGAEGVGEKLLGITNAMGMRAMDQVVIAGKRMTQFARVSNATTAAANATMASVYSIGESMEYFSNTASLAGMTLEQTLALVGKLSQAKITGSAAGTALNNMVQQLMNSLGPFMTPKKAKAFSVLGINPKAIEALVNSGKTYQALVEIEKASRGLSRVDRITTFNALFNMRGQRGIVNAFSEGQKSLEDIRKEIEKGVTGDIVMQQAKAMMDDLHSDFKFLHNAFQEFKISFTKAIEPALRASLKVASKVLHVVSAFIDTPVGKVLAGIVAVATPMIAVTFAFRAALLTATLALNSFARMAGIGGFTGLMGGMLGNWGAMRAGRAGIGGVSKNKAGRFYVSAGQTVDFGGKTYKAGQILPRAFAAGGMNTGFRMGNALGNFFGMSALTASASGSAIVGTLSKVAGWAAKLAGFALRWVPVIGLIWTGVELLKGIFGNTKEKNERDEAERTYYRNLNRHVMDQEMASSVFGSKYFSKLMNIGTGSNQQNSQPINQTINLNMDGKTIFSKKMQQMLNSEASNSSEFNFTY